MPQKDKRAITVRIPRALGARLDQLKERDGTTIQHAVVAALEPYLVDKGIPSKRRAA